MEDEIFCPLADLLSFINLLKTNLLINQDHMDTIRMP